MESGSYLIIHIYDTGNKLLEKIRNVPIEFSSEILPDFVLSSTTCALFLSLRYHARNKGYIHQRMNTIKGFKLRLLLVLVDESLAEKALCFLAQTCILLNFTLICSWTNEEAARYLETYKIYEKKSGDQLQGKVSRAEGYIPQLTAVLTTVPSVNKSDVVTLVSTFGSLYDVIHTPLQEIRLCPGFGQQKVSRLNAAFTTPFETEKVPTLPRLRQSVLVGVTPGITTKTTDGQAVNDLEVERMAEMDVMGEDFWNDDFS